MLLDQVILELCEKSVKNAGDHEGDSCFSETIPCSKRMEDDMVLEGSSESVVFEASSGIILLEKSSKTENLSLGDGLVLEELSDSVAVEGSSKMEDACLVNKDCIGSQEKELNLPLESKASNLCYSLQSQKLGSPSGSFRLQASIPFQWEEKPGKPKHPPTEKPTFALRLPPIRQSRLFSHVGDRGSSREMKKNVVGKHKVDVEGRLSTPAVSKVSSGLEAYKHDVTKDFTASDLESIWEEDYEEEMLELCKKTHCIQDFEDIHSRRSYDWIYPETIEEYMLGIGDFADNRSRTCTPRRRGMISKSAELPLRRFHSPWIGFKSTELGLHDSEIKFLKMAKSPGIDSPCSSWKNIVSDCSKPSPSSSPPALLANCFISLIDMSNAVPVEDSSLKSPVGNDMSIASKEDCLANDGSWQSLVQKSLSGQLRSSQKYHQDLIRSQTVKVASSLQSLKRVSSLVKGIVWNSQGFLSQDVKELECLEKFRKCQSGDPTKDKEEHSDDDDDDDDESSPKNSSVSSFVEASQCLTSSSSSCNDPDCLAPPDCNSCQDLLPLGSPRSRSPKEVVPFGRLENFSNNIVIPIKDDCPNHVKRHFSDGIETKGSMETMDSAKCKGSYGKHAKKTIHAKMQVFSVLFRNFVISCWVPSATRHTNNIGLCRGSGTNTKHCIKKKQVYLSSHHHLRR